MIERITMQPKYCIDLGSDFINPVHIKDVLLADDEVWDLKISLYNTYWKWQKHWKSTGGRGINFDADTINQVAEDLLHEDMKHISAEVHKICGPD